MFPMPVSGPAILDDGKVAYARTRSQLVFQLSQVAPCCDQNAWLDLHGMEIQLQLWESLGRQTGAFMMIFVSGKLS